MTRLLAFTATLIVLMGCRASAPLPSLAVATDVETIASVESARWNERLMTLSAATDGPARVAHGHGIGPDDLLDVVVFGVPELSREVRVSGQGTISLPLLGEQLAAGFTVRGLEEALERVLRETYVRNPRVSVQVKEAESHPISVLGAVQSPGTLRVRGPRPLAEVLAMAGGLSDDAGAQAVILRSQSPRAGSIGSAESGRAEEVDLGRLLDHGESQHNVLVYPGDVVRIARAGVVYVVGEVRSPGVFPIRGDEPLTLMRALALGEGLTASAAANRARIIRVLPTGERAEYLVNIGRVLNGKQEDLLLAPRDVVFVPHNRARSVGLGAIDALVRMVTLRGVL